MRLLGEVISSPFLTLEFPGSENAIAASVALNKLTGISFKTSPVVEVEKFDKLISEAKNI